MMKLLTAPRLRLVIGLTTATLLVLAGGGHAALAEEGTQGLPQFDATYFLTQLFWLTLIFGTFYILIQGVAIPTLVRVLESRDSKINFDIARAEELRNEAVAVSAIIEDKILHARDHARTILSLADREADTVATARLAMFDARIAAKVRDAERRIAHAHENALRDLPDLAGTLVQEVVGRFVPGAAEPALATAAVQAVIKDRVH